MSLVTRLLKKDIRRSLVLLCVWLVLLVLQGALISSNANPGDRPMQALYELLSELVPLFQWLLIIAIVPFVLQEEPLVGTTAFWLTRPISGGSLLKSKALFTLGVLLLPPLVVQAIVFLANGLTAHDVALAAPEIIMEQLAVIILIAVVAVLTPTFGTFAIVSVALLVGFLVTTTVLQWLVLYLNSAAEADNSLEKSRSAAASLLTILAGGAVVTHQYLTRRTLRTIIAASACAIAILTASFFWPWDFLAPPPLTRGTAPFDVTAVKVDLNTDSDVSDIGATRGGGPPEKRIQEGIDLAGVPPSYVLQIERIEPHLTLLDGSSLAPEKPVGNFVPIRKNADSWEAALGGTPVINSGGPSHTSVDLFELDAKTYGKYVDRPLLFSANIDFLALKYVVAEELPLIKGARCRNGSDNLVITDVLRQPDGVDVVLREHAANLLFDRSNSVTAQNEESVIYLLRNKGRNQAMVSKQPASASSPPTSSILVNQTLTLSFGPEENSDVPTPDLTPEWLAGAELVRLDQKPLFAFSKRLVVKDFKINGENGHKPEFAKVEADREALSKIVLPEKASKDQVKEYINTILITMRRQTAFDVKNDPQVAMFAKVGSENLDVLLEARSNLSTDAGPTRYMDAAIKQLARPEDKDLILQALPSLHELAGVVLDHGWQADARDKLIAGLSPKEETLPDAWIKATASFQDPSTYPGLKEYLLRCDNPASTFDTIRNLPGMELKDTVDAMWKNAKRQSYETPDICAIAAESGYVDALEMAANLLRTSEHRYARDKAREVFEKFTPATGDDKALLAWFDANRGKLTFDAQSKKFITKP